MTIRSILLHVAAENCDPECGPAAFALQLAQAFDADLTAAVHELDVVLPRSAYGRQIVAEERVVLDERNAEARVRAARLRDIAAERSIRCHVVTERSMAYGVAETVRDQARLHDIVVAGVAQRGLLNEHAVAQMLVFEAGRPVIVVPQRNASTASTYDRAVVAWDYSRPVARALADATPLLARAAEVTLVAFGDDKEFDASVTRNDVLAALAYRGIRATYEQAERGDRDIAAAINAFAEARSADLLVMGGYGRSRLQELILGGATRGVLGAPVLPTLLSH